MFFRELSIQGFDFSKAFNCSDVHIFAKLNKLSRKLFEINFLQDQNNWKHKLVPIENSKNESDRFVEIWYLKNFMF